MIDNMNFWLDLTVDKYNTTYPVVCACSFPVSMELSISYASVLSAYRAFECYVLVFQVARI